MQISGAAAVQLNLFFAASHSMEPGANAVWAACGVTSPRSDAGRFMSLANATCALALGEQLLGLPAIEFIGALAFHWRLSISEAPLQASTSSGGLPAGNATAEYRRTSQRFSVAGRRAARRRRCRPAWSAFRIVEPPPG